MNCENPITLSESFECANTTAGANALMPTFGLLAALAAVFGLVGLLLLVTRTAATFQAFNRWMDRFGQTIRWAAYGLMGLIPIAAVGVPAYYFATADPGTQAGIGKWLLIVIGGYAALAAFGYWVEKVTKRVKGYIAAAKRTTTEETTA